MSLFGKKEQEQIKVLKQNLSELYEQVARIHVDFRDVLREFDAYIAKYEAMRMGARPCLMAIKGMLSGLQARYHYKAETDEQPSEHKSDKSQAKG